MMLIGSLTRKIACLKETVISNKPKRMMVKGGYFVDGQD
jgi:hypothetical protein